MPMLTVGGILFLITNLQVGVGPHPRHLAGGQGGQGRAKRFSVSAASNGVGPSQDGSFWLVWGGPGIMRAWHLLGVQEVFHE